MSNEPNLPTELSEIEQLLQQFTPAQSAIDRDTLMYQAGRAAAETSIPRNTHWLWPATTAVLAASLIAVLAFPRTVPVQPTTHELANSPQPSVIEVTPPVDLPAEPKIIHLTRRNYRWYPPSATLLVQREQALRGNFQSFRASINQGNDANAGGSTQLQLLQEFLPTADTENSLQEDGLPVSVLWNSGETS